MNALFAIRDATLLARKRLGDGVSVQVRCGECRVVKVAYKANGRAIETPMSNWVPVSAIVATLNGMTAMPSRWTA